MSFSSNLGEINLGEFNLGDISSSESPVEYGNLTYYTVLAATGSIWLYYTGNITYSFSIAITGMVYNTVGNIDLIYLNTLEGNSKQLVANGNEDFSFSVLVDALISYLLAGLSYEFSLALSGTVYTNAHGGLVFPIGSFISGDVYEHNTDFENEQYLRRFVVDTVGLDLDVDPQYPDEDTTPDNDTTDYLKDFLGVGH